MSNKTNISYAQWEINHGEEMGLRHLIISSSTSATHSEKTQECQHPVEKVTLKGAR